MSGRGRVGLVLVGAVVLLGVVGPWLTPFDPHLQIDDANLLPPSPRHLLGTDDLNRDVLSRTLSGIRIDLLVVFLAVPVGAILGSILGLATAWFGSTDVLAQRFFDVILAFPTLVLAITLAAVAGPGAWTMALVIVTIEIPIFGRLARTSLRSMRAMAYVEAAEVVGAGPWWILRRHVLPNALQPLIVQLALSMSVAVFVEGAMSFLGIGVQAPAPSLGSLINDGTRLMYDAPWLALGPLVLVMLLVLGLLLIAQSLSEESHAHA